MDLFAVVDSSMAQTCRKVVEQQGLLDKKRRLCCLGDGYVAIPINDSDCSALAKCLADLGVSFQLLEVNLPPSRNVSRATPALVMKMEVLRLLQEKGSPDWNFEVMMKEVPARWEKHDDLLLLADPAFSSPLWASLGKLLWMTVARCVGASRVAKRRAIQADGYRTPQVHLLLGDSTLITRMENGIKYQYDITKCMFSSGNITERLRVAGFHCHGETVLDLYAGIGYFVLPYLLCTGAFMVHACEWNPDAVMFLRRNLHLNNVHHLCTIHEGDNRELALRGFADRVNLGLIPSSEAGWRTACRALRSTGAVLHLHGNVNTLTASCERHLAEQCFSHQLDQTQAPAGCLPTVDPEASQQEDEHGGFDRRRYMVADGVAMTESKVDNSAVSGNVTVGSNSTNSTSVRAKSKDSWFRWGCGVCHRLQALLTEEHGGRWLVDVSHVQHVKSYAPHVDHIVLDIVCRSESCDVDECCSHISRIHSWE